MEEEPEIPPSASLMATSEEQDCPYCEMSFKSTTSLRTHIGHHFRKGLVNRGVKKTIVISKKKRRVKWSKMKRTAEQQSCDICGKWFSSKWALLRHNMVHTGEKPFECDKCGNSFTTKWALQMHKTTRHKPDKPRFTCSDCGESFGDEATLKDHACDVDVVGDPSKERSLPAEDESNTTSMEETTTEQLPPLQEQRYNCRFCDRKFPNPKALGGHMRMHKFHNQAKPVKWTSERKKTVRVPYKPMKITTYPELNCTVCMKVFKYKLSLRRHMATHSGDTGPFTCPHCSKEFPDIEVLITHMSEHTNSCPVCKEGFDYPSILERHMKQEGHYVGSTELKCTTCSVVFPDEDQLQTHMLSHKSEPFDAQSQTPDSQSRKSPRDKPAHTCTTCDTDCAIRAALKTPPLSTPKVEPYDPGEGASSSAANADVIGESPVPAEKPAVSDDSAAAARRNNLMKCPICKKCYPKGLSYIRHMSWHTRKKERCTVCVCPVCQNKYTLLFNLRRHMKIAHGLQSLQLLKKGLSSDSGNHSDSKSEQIKIIHDVKVPGIKSEVSSDGENTSMKRKRSFEGSFSENPSESADDLKPQKRIRTSPTSRKGLFKCPVCKQCFTWYSNMRSHVRNRHPKLTGRPFMLPRTPVRSSNGKFLCEVCGREFLNNSGLGMHMTTHPDVKLTTSTSEMEPPEEKIHTCGTCGKSFGTAKNLKLHERFHNVAVEKKGDTSVNRYFCPTCNEGFHYYCRLKRHINRYHGAGQNFLPKQKLMMRSFYCRYCPRRFTNSGTLKNHEKSHVRKRDAEMMPPLVGADGAESLPPMVKVDSLPPMVKSESADFLCRMCNKSFSNRGNLMRHFKLHAVHRRAAHAAVPAADPAPTTAGAAYTPSGPRSCTYCHKSFSCQSMLDRHERTHTGEKPYDCPVCGKTFALSGTLSVHIHRVHPSFATSDMKKTPTGGRGRAYRCQACHKGFTSHYSLNGHKRHCPLLKTKQDDLNNNEGNTTYQEENRTEERYDKSYNNAEYDYMYDEPSSYEPDAEFDPKKANSYTEVNGYAFNQNCSYNYGESMILGQGQLKIKQEPKSDTESVDYGQSNGMGLGYEEDSVQPFVSDNDSYLTDSSAGPSTSYQTKHIDPPVEESPLSFKLLSRKSLTDERHSKALGTIKQSVLHQRKMGESGFVLGSIHAPPEQSESSQDGDVLGYLIGHPNGFGPFCCPICYRQFPTPALFADHLMFHSEKCPDAGLLANVFRPANEPLHPSDCNCHLFGLSFPECSKCVQGYVSLDELKRHVKQHVEKYIEHQITSLMNL